MSILDLNIDSDQEFSDGLNTAAPIIEELLVKSGMAENKVIKAMGEKISPHIALELSDDHLDALFLNGINLMQAGEIEKAQSVFFHLSLLKNYEPKFQYALGTTYQALGQYETAAKFYLVFLTYDATSVDGYLRLGECLLGSNEIQNALDTFKVALNLCGAGHGLSEDKVLAQRMVDHASELSRSDI